MISVAVSAFALNKEISKDVLEGLNSIILLKLIRPRDYSLKITWRNAVDESIITDVATSKRVWLCIHEFKLPIFHPDSL